MTREEIVDSLRTSRGRFTICEQLLDGNDETGQAFKALFGEYSTEEIHKPFSYRRMQEEKHNVKIGNITITGGNTSVFVWTLHDLIYPDKVPVKEEPLL